MPKDNKKSQSGTDKEALEIVNDAEKQYREYLYLNDVAYLVEPSEPTTHTKYTWDHPLTLIMK